MYMTADHVHRTVVARLGKFVDKNKVQSFLSNNNPVFGSLGSHPTGQVISRLTCANLSINGCPCLKPASVACANCHLVAYCSGDCQKSHWRRHRSDCKHPYLKPTWQPAWMIEKREPKFVTSGVEEPPPAVFGTLGNHLWGNVPAIDCLQIPRNEGESAAETDFKLCFAASGDIRNLVQTINGLPDNYRGKCEILYNDLKSIVANRNLIILFALLGNGPSLEEAAEAAVHLMYSAALPVGIMAYYYRCIDIVYNIDTNGTEHSEIHLDLRGQSKLHSMQASLGIQLMLDGLLSAYKLPRASKSMNKIMIDPSRVDHRDRYLSGLEPAHRLGFSQFRTTGVLAPFSADVSHFVQPNRLMFTGDGGWLTLDTANPLFGWDVSAVRTSGVRHGVDPADIYGCLFFHVKDEFLKFATRVREFNIEIHVTQYHAHILSQFISDGTIPPFHANCFDRIETSNLAEYTDLPQVLNDWGPFLKHQKHATLFMQFMNWHTDRPNATAQPSTIQGTDKMKRCAEVLGLDLKKIHSEGQSSPSLFRLIESLDAFHDNERPFQEYLDAHDTNDKAASQGLRLRSSHRIHPKRLGLSLDAPQETIPNLSKERFYDLFTIGNADFTRCFVEFEVVAPSS